MKIRYFFLLPLFLLQACGTNPIPEDHYYRLEETNPKITLNKPLQGLFAVAPVSGIALLQSRAITYTKAAQPNELAHYHYRHWADDPTILIQAQMLDYFKKINLSQQIQAENDRIQWDYLLKTRIRHFERILKPEGVDIKVTLEFHLLNNQYQILMDQTLTATVSTDKVFYHSIQAFSQALDQIFAQITQKITTK